MSDEILLVRAVTIFGMLFWFAFPIGMMISVVQQDRDAYPTEEELESESEKEKHAHDYKKSA